jgi:copper(I)-binding protein
MQLTSANDARLVKADSPVAKIVEIHEMVMKNHVMKMRTISAIDLLAGKTVALKPNGYMVMLTGLKQQIKEGDSVPVSIVIEGKNRKRETIALSVPALRMDSAASEQHAHAHIQESEVASGHERTHQHTK